MNLKPLEQMKILLAVSGVWQELSPSQSPGGVESIHVDTVNDTVSCDERCSSIFHTSKCDVTPLLSQLQMSRSEARFTAIKPYLSHFCDKCLTPRVRCHAADQLPKLEPSPLQLMSVS